MNETTPNPEIIPPEVQIARERTKQATIAGWTAGVSAMFAAATLGTHPTWPVAFGVAALAVMVTVICYGIIKH